MAEINILVEDDISLPFTADWLEEVVTKVLDAENAGTAVELGLVISGEGRIHELNREYRGIDEPTDVLAFAAVEQGEGPDFIPPPDGIRHLGEVIVSYPQAVRQAEDGGHSAEREVALLVIHGVLHLLGYDHEEVEAEAGMTARQDEILAGVMQHM